jgi:hypothetical protein
MSDCFGTDEQKKVAENLFDSAVKVDDVSMEEVDGVLLIFAHGESIGYLIPHK